VKEALFYDKLGGKKVRCRTCYRYCEIPNKSIGYCRIRKNIDGKLYLTTYGKAYSPSLDPIEKKPFFHFKPGAVTYSFCTPGCNFHCLHCCNSHLSQGTLETVPCLDYSPKDLVNEAKKLGSNIISYTYTEPTVFFEYAYDTGVLARKEGMKNAFVTNGYASPEVVKKSKDFLDAVRIDLKGDEKHYKEICGGIELDNVLECIKNYWKITKNLEIITLVIEGNNDNKDFVAQSANFLKKLSPEIPWHFIPFYPTYKMLDKKPTTETALRKMRNFALEEGMKYVYGGDNNTYCPKCEKLLIERSGFSVKKHILSAKCPSCGHKIPLVF